MNTRQQQQPYFPNDNMFKKINPMINTKMPNNNNNNNNYIQQPQEQSSDNNPPIIKGIIKNSNNFPIMTQITSPQQQEYNNNLHSQQQQQNIFANDNKPKKISFQEPVINDDNSCDINDNEFLANEAKIINYNLKYINNNIKYSESKYNLEYYIKMFTASEDDLQLIYLIYDEYDFKDILKLCRYFSEKHAGKKLDLLTYNNYYPNVDTNNNHILSLPINNMYDNNIDISYIDWLDLTTKMLTKQHKGKINNSISAENAENKKIIFICFEKKLYSSYLAGIQVESPFSINKNLTNYLKSGIIIDTTDNIINNLYTTYFSDIIIKKKHNTKYYTLDKYITEINDINNNSHSYVNRIIDTIFSDEENPINNNYKSMYSQIELKTIIKHMKDLKIIPKYNCDKNNYNKLNIPECHKVNYVIANFARK